MKKVALIQGGMGVEREVSFLSAKAVAKKLKELHIPYHVVECDSHIVENLKSLKPNRAFLAVHGPYAEDGTLQGLLEYLKIPYTGSGVLSSALCMDKCVFKDFISRHKIPTPDYQTLNLKLCEGENTLSLNDTGPFSLEPNLKTGQWEGTKPAIAFKREFSHIHLNKVEKSALLPLPFVVKPARSGSTLGISICRKKKEILPAFKKALKYDHKILIESYVKGPELAFSYLNGKILTPIEVVAEKGFYDYKSKYQSQKTQYILPPRLDKQVIEKGRKIALKAFKLTQVRTYGRADFMVQNHQPLMTEINTLPGLTQKSLFPKSAKHDGISFTRLIEQILNQATLDYP